MDHPAIQFTTVFMAFFAIMNPIANAPIFVGVTDGLDARTRRGIALRAVLIAFSIVAAFTIGGRWIFQAFGITLPAFRIAGGALVGLIGFHMLQGNTSTVHAGTVADTEQSRDSALGLAITPLALPLLAGPGTIATAMNYAAESTVPQVVRVLVAFGVMCFLTLVAFIAGNALVRFLGQNAIKAVIRLMGLILAVIGVQMMIVGVQGAVAMPTSG